MSGQKFVDNIGRRTWDIDTYAKKAAEIEASKDIKQRPLTQKLLEPRGKVDLEAALERKKGISTNRGGYYCEVCEVLLTDSMGFLNHINGKKHQKALGVSMHHQRSTLEEVTARIQYHENRIKKPSLPLETVEERMARREMLIEQGEKKIKKRGGRRIQAKREKQQKYEQTSIESQPIGSSEPLATANATSAKNTEDQTNLDIDEWDIDNAFSDEQNFEHDSEKEDVQIRNERDIPISSRVNAPLSSKLTSAAFERFV